MSGLALRDLVGPGPLLLDFDGPVCSIFAGYPAAHVAGELVEVLDSHAVAVPPHVRCDADPLAVLRWAGDACPFEVMIRLEHALSEAELRAAAVAAPTPFGREVILGAHRSGLPVAVVSNNSRAAIEAYLSAQGLAPYIAPIIGRPYGEPTRMKPNPSSVLAAVRILGAQPAQCTLVGDSLSDIAAARAAGVSVIGFANRPRKVEPFAAADAVITSMSEIAALLSSVPQDGS